jgi:Leucine-rich repeat (LRR) protein
MSISSLSKESQESQESPRKYTIYRNDLKYRRNRNLNSEKIIWDEDKLKYLFENINLDSLEYRLYECKKSDMNNLDLNNMDLCELNLSEIPDEIIDNVKCLFIAENDLEYLPDLTNFKKLEILEIGNNMISELGKLPTTLQELSCRGNRLSSLPDPAECPNLIRIDCTNNEITEILRYPKLKNLVCSSNKISTIPNLGMLEILICNNNIINYIDKCDNLRYLDCSMNKLVKLNDYKILVDLICSGNNIGELIPYSNLKYLEIFNTNINAIHYMEKLQELFCDKAMVKKLSKKYVTSCTIEIKIHKENMLQLIFTKKS